MGEINSFPIFTKTVLELDELPGASTSYLDRDLIYDESVGAWKTQSINERRKVLATIYPTVAALQSADLAYDLDIPIYVQVEENDYTLYKIINTAPEPSDILLNNGNVARPQPGTNSLTVNTRLNIFDKNPRVGDVVTTKGCDAIADGGHGTFDIVASTSLPVDGYAVIGSGPYAVLRPPHNACQFGASKFGLVGASAGIQRAIDFKYAQGGGDVHLLDGQYLIDASSLSETYDNAGVSVPASDCGIVVRPGVNLIGSRGKRVRLVGASPTLILIAPVAPDSVTIYGLSIDGAWTPGNPGAGHGIFTLGTAGGADVTCRKVNFKNISVRNVASYGIAFQNGSPKDCHVSDIYVENCGADGVDLKARSDVSTEPTGNTATNITVKNHNLRVDGSAGVDVRGIWQLKNINVTEFGGDPAKSYLGIRFRTKPPVSDAYNKAAARSTLEGFYIKPTVGAAALAIDGVQSGSDDVHIVNGTTDGCKTGVNILGNANGAPARNHVTNVTCLNSTEHGFRIRTDASDTHLTNCDASGSTTAGFRNEGINTVLTSCSSSDATPISTSAGAVATEVQIGCRFGDSGLSIYQSASGRMALEAKGSATNIDINFRPKGTGRVRYGVHTANADAPITGYIEIRDDAGNLRKLAVIS